MKLESFGPYIVNQLEVTGSQQDAYQAFDTQARRPVTIKQFSLSTSSTAGRRLIERLRQSTRLTHPYIARVYDVGVVDNRPFLVMEYLDDRTLADALTQLQSVNQRPAPAQIVRQLGLIADALDYAHAQGVVHGHLSADQILLTDVDDPVLTGFGWEIADPNDKSSDLLALSRILYKWLTGRSLIETEPFGPQTANLPGAIQAVFEKAVAPDPAQRFSSAQALAAAFTSAVDNNLLEKEVGDPVVPPTIGRYQVEVELGRRGPTIVYRAYDEKLARRVAIKLLPAQDGSGQTFRANFKQEIELIATLEHPCIVKVYDFGEYEQRPYVVMPYLDGGTLETRLRAEGRLKPQSLVPIIERVATALDEAHARGIVHGQIMPNNILFDGQGQAYLSDFSISAITETWTNLIKSKDVALTTSYMSPEQIQALINGEPAHPDARSDIYALGVVIFEALTGQTPHQAASPFETVLAQLESPIPLIREINPELPQAYQTIVERTLAKEPQDRYPTAGTLAARIKEIQTGRWHLSRISDLIEVPPLIPPPATLEARVSRPPSAPKDTASIQKFDRYHLARELGRGGMGVVYLAYDPILKRQVAIKVLPGHLAMTPELRRRFQREAKLIARLNHDAIAHVYDVGEYENQLYIVMRYLSGGTLAQKIAQNALKLHQIGPIIERVAEALDTAHAHQIIHYDVKPGNILFDAKGDAFLADFGIAVLQAQTSDETMENSLAGTPKYMSPEQVKAVMKQIDRKEVDGRSDIYALGVVLFEMLTGQTPYVATTARDTALAHLTEPIPDIFQIKANLPSAAQDIINRALAKNPTERYQTAQAMAADVTDLTSGRWLLRQLIE
ncbi:MAG: protein kinase [Anaerolineae bacterium]|nr:protein kinase [Anaerolineae bacterium]